MHSKVDWEMITFDLNVTKGTNPISLPVIIHVEIEVFQAVDGEVALETRHFPVVFLGGIQIGLI